MKKNLKQKGKKENHQKSGTKKNRQVFYDENYIKKAEEIERALWEDGDFDEDEEEPTDEEEACSYAALIQRLKAEGVYQEDEKEAGNADAAEDAGNSKHLLPDSRVLSFPRKRRISVGRVAGVALLCCACVFAASMTSEANRNYFVKGMRYLVGDDTRIIAGNDGENENINYAEQDAIKEIETKLNVEMPEFCYRPQKFNFLRYEISELADIARIEYEYQDSIVCFVIDKQNEKVVSRTLSADGKKESFSVTSYNNILVTVEELQEEQDAQSSYTAAWEKDNVVYWLSGKIEKEEMIKILEQMVFLE
nr:DUF4367 domain-containing protein [uncultured Blautia sp.]